MPDEGNKRPAAGDEDGAPKKAARKTEEVELDSAVDAKATVREAIAFDPVDTTLNVIPALGGKVLMALTDGGMQYLLAGARASVGARGGRHLFEARIIEALNPSEASTIGQSKCPKPRQLIRVGVSTANSQLVLGESPDGICFDSDGNFIVDGTKTMVAQPYSREHVIGVLLNLDPKSPNANTVSLFRNGERVSDPQAIPERLRGQALFPHVAFRNVSVHVHFGPQPLAPLPFKCRMLAGAAQADVVVKPSSIPKDGKYEVMLPVGFPDEGTFDSLDEFLAANPHFVELSDRKILEWATLSGLRKPRSMTGKDSNDRPDFNFGLPGMDDLSARRLISAIAPVIPRNFVVMEVKGNLVASERAEVLKRFSAPHYKRVACVIMGEPADKFKDSQRKKLTAEKQAVADEERIQRHTEAKKKKELLKRQKQLTEMRKQAEEKRRIANEMAKKAAEEAEPADGAVADEDQKKLQEVAKQEAEKVAAQKAAEAVKATQEAKEAAEDDAVMEERVLVQLTEEEKNTWFRSKAVPDLTPNAFSQSLAQFSIPEKAEGFQDIRFEWQPVEKSKEYLRKRIVEKKLTARMEDLVPSEWFNGKIEEWRKLYDEWQAKQKKYQADHPKKTGDKAIDALHNPDADKVADDLDIFSVEDVCNVGNGEPLFNHFSFEDWAMLQLRYELYLLVQAYRRDVNDPERVGIHESNIAYYYNKYYRKQLSPTHYNVTNNSSMCELIKDAVTVSKGKQVLVSELSDDMDNVDIFVKLTEESRRERQRAIDAGDETAKIKFSSLALHQLQVSAGGPTATGIGAGRVVQPAKTWQNLSGALASWKPQNAGGGSKTSSWW